VSLVSYQLIVFNYLASIWQVDGGCRLAPPRRSRTTAQQPNGSTPKQGTRAPTSKPRLLVSYRPFEILLPISSLPIGCPIVFPFELAVAACLLGAQAAHLVAALALQTERINYYYPFCYHWKAIVWPTRAAQFVRLLRPASNGHLRNGRAARDSSSNCTQGSPPAPICCNGANFQRAQSNASGLGR